MAVKLRSEIDSAYKWRLEDLFASDADWEKEYREIKALLPQITRFKGALSKSIEMKSENLDWQSKYQTSSDQTMGVAKYQNVLAQLDDLKLIIDKFFKIHERLGRLYVYAAMRRDEDTSNNFYQGIAHKANNLRAQVASDTAFVRPEILYLEKKFLENFGGRYGEYRQFIDDLLRVKKYVLSPELEAMLASFSLIASDASNIFSMLNNADITFGELETQDETGVHKFELTHGNYAECMRSRDRSLRIQAFNKYYDAYNKQKNTLASLYHSSVKGDVLYTRAKKFYSCMSRALFANNICENVYYDLISTVGRYLPVFHDYIAFCKTRLGLNEMHVYDLYTPIFQESDNNKTFEEAKEIVKQALTPLGEDYIKNLETGFKSGWIDVYENKNKRSGAYSWGAFGCHPFVLLNYNNKLEDVFTLAHEMGHAMHSYYVWKTQAYVNSDYSIFLAEVASTVNEVLLNKYLLEKAEDPKVRAYLINHFLEGFRTTVFRQTLFAEFELKTHDLVERDEALTVEVLNKIYRDLNKKYYGPHVVFDEKSDIEWARVPHFYNSFYVYQYATGYSSAVSLAKKIFEKDIKSTKAYQRFLKYGSSYYPMDVLRWAGVDLRKPQAIIDALDYFRNLLIELKTLCLKI